MTYIMDLYHFIAIRRWFTYLYTIFLQWRRITLN